MSAVGGPFVSTQNDADRVTFAPGEAYDIEAGPSVDSISVGVAYHF